MKIHALHEGKFIFDNNRNITLFDKNPNQSGLKVGICPFLVECGNNLVIIDAGLGWNIDGMPMIHTNIIKAGFKPEDITVVLLSHLHKDHILGLVDQSSNNWRLNFPNANVYLQRREYDYARLKLNNNSYDLDALEFIVDKAKIIWLEENQGLINNEIRYEVTGGHTAFHQVFFIKRGYKIAFFGGDNLPTLGYLKYNTAYKTDCDGRKALQDRLNWEIQAKEENWTVLFYHDFADNIVVF